MFIECQRKYKTKNYVIGNFYRPCPEDKEKLNQIQRLYTIPDTGRKLNVHKTFRRRPGRLLKVLCTFIVCSVPRGILSAVITTWSKIITLLVKCPNTDFFLVRIFLNSVRIHENTDQEKLYIWTLFTQ